MKRRYAEQRKEEKGERASSKGPSTEVSPVEVEPIEPRQKNNASISRRS